MANIWTGECVIAEHRDMQATSLGLNLHGTHAILAGRRNLALIELEKSSVISKRVSRLNKWEVGVVAWCPTSLNEHMFALTCNQSCELFSCQNDSITSKDILHGHTRVISDLDWNKFDPNLLATSSIDTYIFAWDIREPRRPTIVMSAVASATQVKWNRIVRNTLATSHEGDLRLWDLRKANTPVAYLAAHLSKIHNIDWSPFHPNVLVTSSQDCTVKFFDINNPKKSSNVLTTSCPVWRAKFTPFPGGLVTVVVPQLRQGDTSVTLWNISNLTNPMHSFVGHRDVVLVFDWKKEGDTEDYQLVTWSKDQTLRIWRMDSYLQQFCGFDSYNNAIISNEELYKKEKTSLGLTASNGVTKNEVSEDVTLSEFDESAISEVITTKDGSVSSAQPKSLKQEFSLMSTNIPSIAMKSKDIGKRTCTVTARVGTFKVCLQIVFPPKYPIQDSPTFNLLPDSKIDDESKVSLFQVLEETAFRYTRRNHCCLEPCLRELVASLEGLTKSDEEVESVDVDEPIEEVSTITYGSSKDASIPFPRSSGARFCGNNYLVCFGKPNAKKKLTSLNDKQTPRSLFAMGGTSNMHIMLSPSHTPSFVAESPGQGMTIPSYTLKERPVFKSVLKSKHDPDAEQKNQKCVTVLLYDLSQLFALSRDLACRYVINKDDIVGTCNQNAAVANTVGRKDLVQLWTLAGLIAGPMAVKENPDEGSWVHHPFGRQLIEDNIEHYIKYYDLQTVAMLCCVFGTFNSSDNSWKSKCTPSGNSPGGSPYHTVHLYNSGMDARFLPKQHRSNSWSDTFGEVRVDSVTGETTECYFENEMKETLLDPKKNCLYDNIKRIYADVLYRWGLLNERALVLKFVSTLPEAHKGVDFMVECQYCREDVRGSRCFKCKKWSFRCSVCKTAVKGKDEPSKWRHVIVLATVLGTEQNITHNRGGMG